MTVVAKAEFAQSYIAHPQIAFRFFSKEIAPHSAVVFYAVQTIKIMMLIRNKEFLTSTGIPHTSEQH
jgi:hypothetical protein